MQPRTAQPFASLGVYLLCRGDYAAAVRPLARATVLDITDSHHQREELSAARARRRPAEYCG